MDSLKENVLCLLMYVYIWWSKFQKSPKNVENPKLIVKKMLFVCQIMQKYSYFATAMTTCGMKTLKKQGYVTQHCFGSWVKSHRKLGFLQTAVHVVLYENKISLDTATEATMYKMQTICKFLHALPTCQNASLRIWLTSICFTLIAYHFASRVTMTLCIHACNGLPVTDNPSLPFGPLGQGRLSCNR